MATDGDATLTLWRLLASNRGVSGQVTFYGGPEEPLFLLLAEQDTEVLGDWRWMTRLVDLAGAVEARGWPGVADAQIHLHVSDDLAGWNDGRWVLTVKDGQGLLEEGGRGSVRTQSDSWDRCHWHGDSRDAGPKRSTRGRQPQRAPRTRQCLPRTRPLDA